MRLEEQAKPKNLAVVLLCIFFIQGIFLIQNTSPTADEISFNMVNGYTYLKTHDYRMTPANPALIREWIASPWLFLGLRLDLDKSSWKEADSVPFGKEFFYHDNISAAETLLFISRFMILVLGLAMGVIVFLWARQLYGEWAAVLAMCLYAFCPNLLAHSALATTDIGVAFFSTAAAFFLWRYLEYSKRGDRWAFFLMFALACAAKFNAPLLGPVFLLVLWIKKGFREFVKCAFYMLAAAFLIVWASYGFEWKSLLGGSVPRIDEKLGYLSSISGFLFPRNESIRNTLEKFALHTPVPMPSYLLGMAGIARSHRAPYSHYLFGHWTTDVQWYYYLFCFAIKMTLPFLALLILRVVFFKKSSASSKHENLVILLPVAALFAVTFEDSTAVGIRYLLPVIPMLFVWVSGLAKWSAGSSARKGFLICMAAANILTTVPVFPHYLSYFNPIVGGVNGGYRLVRGSDVDWGQGLKELARYLKDKNIDRVTMEYFGYAEPGYYGIRSEPLPELERIKPKNKVYAISLFYLEHAQWSKDLKPTAMVGGSIMVYDLRS